MSDNPPWHTRVSPNIPSARSHAVNGSVPFYVLEVPEHGAPDLSLPMKTMGEVVNVLGTIPPTSWVLAFRGELLKLETTTSLVSLVDKDGQSVRIPLSNESELVKLFADRIPKLIQQQEIEEYDEDADEEESVAQA